MKTKIVAALAALLFAVPTLTAAQTEGGYYGVNFTSLTGEIAPVNGISADDVSHFGVVLRGGLQINPNFAIEGRLAFPLGDDTSTVRNNGTPAGTVDLQVTQMLGLYIRANGSSNSNVKPYFLFGFTDAEIEATGNSTISASDSSTAYGIGLDFEIENSTIGLEYTNYYSGDGDTITGFGFNWVSTFK